MKGNEYRTNRYGDTFNFHFSAPNFQKTGINTEIKRFTKSIIGVWKHMIVTYNGKKINTFVDNKLTNSVSIDLDIGKYDTDIFIAKHGNLYDSNRDYTPIVLDDLYIYNRALNEAEIAELYEMGQ